MRTNTADMHVQRLAIERESIIQEIRDYVRDQKDLWAQIPYLALQANGRTGFSDNFSRAHDLGYWAIKASVRNGYYEIYIDCAIGELVDPRDPAKAIGDSEVLMLLSDLSQLDASEIIEKLRREAGEPVKCYSEKDQAEHELWRTKKARELDLQKVYVRQRHYPAEFEVE